jgi:sugar phosphate isomerase/epimerase
MATTLKGPGIFIAQFAGPSAPFDTLDGIAAWAAALGYQALQLPTSDVRFIDLALAADSRTYCDELKGRLASHGLEITDLSTHLQGQLIACHSAYQPLFEAFAPPGLRGRPDAQREWAREQLILAARASTHLGLRSHATFSGALLWHLAYPWPQRPAGLVEEGFARLAALWAPVLDAFDDAGVDLCYELHPGEDLHDGITFERFLDATGRRRCVSILYDPSHLLLQHVDYLGFIDVYHERIRAFHVKDAEFRPSARSGVYGGYQPWLERAGRFRSVGDGQVDFGGVFSRLAQYDYRGWAVLEWECCLKHPEDGAREGAKFIRDHIIRVTDRAFDDFSGSGSDPDLNHRVLEG